MAKFKIPFVAALVVAAIAFAVYSGWKTFLSPYIPAPPPESGLPEASPARR
jgi:hypothetical protein